MSDPETEILDRGTLDLLEKDGSDLSKPHTIEHLLFVSSESHGHDAVAILADRGYSVELEPPQDDWHPTFWRVFATKSVVPTWGNIREMRRHMEEIARRGGGEYDGWGTQVVL